MTNLSLVPAYQDDPQVLEAQTESLTIAEQARALQIVDAQTFDLAASMLAQARKATKRIDALRTLFVKPLNDHVKTINAFFAEMAGPASEADRILAGKTNAWRAKVAEDARKEQERLRKLQEQRYERAVAKAEVRGVEPPPMAPIIPTVAAPAKTVTTTTGEKLTYRKNYSFEITDPLPVPRDWCCPDEKKIGQAVRAQIITEANAPAGIRVIVSETSSVY
jgi:hypothetical protein